MDNYFECFVSRREPAALESRLWFGMARWSGGVCRRILRNRHDAEDAFQATFLVLVRRASCVQPRSIAANWLYGVACQTARKARATAAKRATRETQEAEKPEPEAKRRDLAGDLPPLLDEELARLPDKYRSPVVLCDLEGKTRKEAAAQLGLPEGTAASRLARGRAMLARRLARLDLAISAASLGAALSQGRLSVLRTGRRPLLVRRPGRRQGRRDAAEGVVPDDTTRADGAGEDRGAGGEDGEATGRGR